MNIGKSMKNMRGRNELSQENVANDLFVDQTLISKIEKGKRNATKELAKNSLQLYEDATYNMEVTHEFSNGYTAPVINGEAIDRSNHLAVMVAARKEIDEVEEVMQLDKFLRNPELATEQDRESAIILFKESKEAADVLYNLCARLSEAYKFSPKEMNRQVLRKWKATEVVR